MLNKTRFGYKQAWFLHNGKSVRDSNIICLQSYNTLIAVYNVRTDTLYLTPHKWSRTTSKHLSQWRSELSFFHRFNLWGCKTIVCDDEPMWRYNRIPIILDMEPIVIMGEVVE